MPLDQRLANYIIEGSKDGLVDDLNRKLAENVAPLDVINGPLMAGMGEVGRLFNNNELIVAEVLQSAEAMKAAVGHLEQFMEKADTEKRAKVMLATVKGDVHDIGKNLVEIILKNNGYDVINLGIKVPPEELIRAHREHQPDAIGLSGLLVKSAQQMVITASDLREAGITVPLLVGGAALSDKFTRLKIAPQYSQAVCYAKDAMTGLRLMNELSDPVRRDNVLQQHTHVGAAVLEEPAPEPLVAAGEERSPHIRIDLPIPPVAYLERKVRSVPDLQEVWSYINPFMLFGRHLGFRGNFEKALAEHDARAIELQQNMEEVKQQAAEFMKIGAVWQFFEAERRGNSIALFAPGETSPAHTFHFQRQRLGDKLCLSDYVLPPQNGTRDHVALFVVTAGAGIREKSEEAKAAGRYLYSHGLQALAIETAEACAEWLHRRIREDWGFPDPPAMTHAGAIHLALSRQALQLRLSGVPESGRPGRDLDAPAPGRDRRAFDRGNDDGSGSERQRAGVPSSRLHLLFRGRIVRPRFRAISGEMPEVFTAEAQRRRERRFAGAGCYRRAFSSCPLTHSAFRLTFLQFLARHSEGPHMGSIAPGLYLSSTGSYPRVGDAPELQLLERTIAALDRGERTSADLLDAQNTVTRGAIADQVKAGLDIVTDGQIRWSDPISYIPAKLDNIELQGSVPYFDTEKLCRQPLFTGTPARRGSLVVAEYSFARNALGHLPTPANKAGKLAIKPVLTGPYTLAKFSLSARSENGGASTPADAGSSRHGLWRDSGAGD